MKEEYEQMIKGIRERHDQEQSNFIARLDSLTQTNERFASQNQKYIKMESQLYELRQKYKGLSSLNNNVNHLWEVKEVEYSNINEILKTVNNR